MRNLAAKRSCHWLKTRLLIFLLLAFKVAGGVMLVPGGNSRLLVVSDSPEHLAYIV